MIHIAPADLSSGLLNLHLGNELSAKAHSTRRMVDTSVAFIGFAKWREGQENTSSQASDEQVLCVRDGKVSFLDPHNEVEKLSQRFAWGSVQLESAQLAIAMLMEVLGDWERIEPIWPKFQDCVVAQLPRNTNWTADGSAILGIALSIERQLHIGRR